MSFSPRGCALRQPHRQLDHFSNVGLKSSTLDRSYSPHHNLWNPNRSDSNEPNGPNGNRFGSPSPTKFRRFSRRISGEEWISGDGDSRLNHTRENAPNADFVPDFNHLKFSSDHSRDNSYPAAGFNNKFFNEPLHGNNSQRWGVTNRVHYKKRSKSHGSRRSKNPQNELHRSPNVSSKHRFSLQPLNQRHRDESRRNELPSRPTDVENILNSPGEPVGNSSSRNSSPEKWTGRNSSSPVEPFKESEINIVENNKVDTDDASIILLEEIQKCIKKKKKKRKKKKKNRRKSRSRSRETRRCSTEKTCPKKTSSEEGHAHYRKESPSKLDSNTVRGTGNSTPCGVKSLRNTSSTKEGDSAEAVKSPTSSVWDSKSINAPENSEPDSYVCAIVKKRRLSSQDKEESKEGSAILKFTRVEGQRKPGSPKKSCLGGLVKRSQDSTPTSAKKIERTGGGTEAVTPSTETKSVEKNAVQRFSPIKPKAIIKPGLRSVKKDPKPAHEPKRRSKSPQKKDIGDSTRKLVQRTLESYFCKSASKVAAQAQQVEPTDATCSVETSKTADQEKPSRSHVRRIYCDAVDSTPRAVVQITPISEGLIRTLRSPKMTTDSEPRGRWGSTSRLAEVRPIPSPAKKRPCESPPPEEPTKVAPTACGLPRVTRAASLESAPSDLDGPDQQLDVLPLEEDLAQTQRDEAAREAEVKKAAQRNRKRHTRGLKVFVFCDVLREDIERHPVQNEIPANKWSKWLNPAQLRCLVSAMLDNIDLCLKFTLDGERNEEWEEYWLKLARRLNTVCFNDLTNLNTGLRMTVLEWKTCWLDFKTTVKKRVDAMTPKERVHNMGSLDCLLYSKDLYTALIKSKGECLGDECPKIWCPGACVGVFCPTEPVRIRTTEE